MGHESIAGDNQQSEQEGLRADRRLAEPASGGGISVRLHGRHLPEKELSGVIESIAILVAIGVNSDGNREVIGAAEGGREDKESWIRFLRSLKDRGLHGTRLIVGARCVVFEFYATIILTLCCTTKYTFSVAPCMATVPETYISFSCTKFRYRKIAI